MLAFAIVIWNALVVAAWGRPDFLEDLRGRLDTLPGNDIVVGAFDRLVASKRQRHAADDRAVGNWELRLKGDLPRALGRSPALTDGQGTARTYRQFTLMARRRGARPAGEPGRAPCR